MHVLVTLWGVPLTAHFARKGGYSGSEDYCAAVIILPALTVLENRDVPFGAIEICSAPSSAR